jgi:aspartate kinase
MLLTAGERMSAALLAMAIHDHGMHARSLTGSQAGIITTGTHGNARIIDITPGRITSALDRNDIVIVAGFQGVAQDTKDVTTLGRGASDTTAVALAASLGADHCEIIPTSMVSIPPIRELWRALASFPRSTTRK